MYRFWRNSIAQFGGAVVVTKTPKAYIPEPPVVALSVDDITATAYRFRQGINVFPTFEGELAYIRGRNDLHRRKHLDGVPKGSLLLDMFPLLMHRGGMGKAADRVQEFLARVAFG